MDAKCFSGSRISSHEQWFRRMRISVFKIVSFGKLRFAWDITDLFSFTLITLLPYTFSHWLLFFYPPKIPFDALNIIIFVMLTWEIEHSVEKEIKSVLFYGSYTVYFSGTFKILCTELLSGINVLQDHLQNTNKRVVANMGKYRFLQSHVKKQSSVKFIHQYRVW